LTFVQIKSNPPFIVSEIFLALLAPNSNLGFALPVARLSLLWPKAKLGKQGNWNRLELRGSFSFRFLLSSFLPSSLLFFFHPLHVAIRADGGLQKLMLAGGNISLNTEPLVSSVRHPEGQVAFQPVHQ
jgi:hypothetical protein